MTSILIIFFYIRYIATLVTLGVVQYKVHLLTLCRVNLRKSFLTFFFKIFFGENTWRRYTWSFSGQNLSQFTLYKVHSQKIPYFDGNNILEILSVFD